MQIESPELGVTQKFLTQLADALVPLIEKSEVSEGDRLSLLQKLFIPPGSKESSGHLAHSVRLLQEAQKEVAQIGEEAPARTRRSFPIERRTLPEQAKELLIQVRRSIETLQIAEPEQKTLLAQKLKPWIRSLLKGLEKPVNPKDLKEERIVFVPKPSQKVETVVSFSFKEEKVLEIARRFKTDPKEEILNLKKEAPQNRAQIQEKVLLREEKADVSSLNAEKVKLVHKEERVSIRAVERESVKSTSSAQSRPASTASVTSPHLKEDHFVDQGIQKEPQEGMARVEKPNVPFGVLIEVPRQKPLLKRSKKKKKKGFLDRMDRESD